MYITNTFTNNPQAEFVIGEIRKQSKTLADDVVCAYKLFYDNNPDLNGRNKKQLEYVFLMCKFMEPEAEDVISMLLYRDSLVNKATLHIFKQYFVENRCDLYYNHVQEACKNAPKNPEWSDDESIRYYIMIRVCDKMFARLMRSLNKNRAPNAYNVSTAYELAKKAHNWSMRNSGVPYLVHPIGVANILLQIGVESHVIAAALLHDVVEDTDYTLEDISKQCNPKIARYVDAVTSVHREYANSHHFNEYQCDNAELDKKSFNKLVRSLHANPEMIFALYIKAADRIHNLRTIDFMSSINIHNKNDETQMDYLPLFKAFNLNYFVKTIEDLMWRATDIERYTKMQEKYDDMVFRNRVFIDEFEIILKKHIEKETTRYAQSIGSAGYDVEICERPLLPYEVYNHIKNSGGNIDNLSKRIDKRFVPVCDIDIIFDSKDANATLDVFVSGFVKVFESKIAMTGRTIVDFKKEEKTFVIEVEDHYRNVFSCRVITREDYEVQRKGVYINDYTGDLEAEVGVKTEKITVELRNGKTILLPKGSTVIDVAFAIHEEIGRSVKAATINGRKATIYNTLLEGDKVIVEADTCRANGVTKMLVSHVRISWLNYVATKRARRSIIEFLTQKYYDSEGDDPKYESPAQTNVVETVADKIIQEIGINNNNLF